MEEIGFPGFEAVPWFGLMAPAGTPQAIIDKAARARPSRCWRCRTCASGSRTSGLDVIGSTPAEFAEVIKTEIPYWAKVIKEAGIKATE